MRHISVVEIHGAITHFPVAMLIAAVAFEIAFLLFHKKEWHIVSFWLLVTAVIGAVPSLITGWLTGSQLFSSILHPPTNFTLHRLLAFVTSSIALTALVLRILSKDSANGVVAAISVILLLSSGITVSYTGYLGGMMVFGSDTLSTLPVATMGSPAISRQNNSTLNQTIIVDPKLITNGQSIYQKNGCSNCHMMNGHGASVGPNLTHEGARNNSIIWQVKHLVNPSQVNPGSFMPSYKQLQHDQLKALAAFLTSKR